MLEKHWLMTDEGLSLSEIGQPVTVSELDSVNDIINIENEAELLEEMQKELESIK